MSIDRILADITSRGVSHKNRFEVVVGRVPGLPNTDSLVFSCEVASIPGRGYDVGERITYGPIIKLPTSKLYNEFTATFRCDAQMSEKIFFDDWFDLIAVKDEHHFNYYDEYTSTITVSQLNGANKSTYKAELKEAYPTIVGDLMLDHAAQNEIHKLEVTFAYKEWDRVSGNAAAL